MNWLSGWAYPPSALHELAARTAPFPFVGSWSLGSFQSLEMAAQDPTSVRALVLVSSTPRFCAAEDFPCGMPGANLRAMQRAFAREARPALESFHRLCAAPEDAEDGAIAARTDASLEMDPGTLADGLRDLREKDLRAKIGAVSCPVLLLHGEEDRVIPCDAARWMEAHLPRAKLVTLPGAGHDLPLRHADWCAGRIADFAGQLA